MPPAELSSSEAERLRAFERQGHDALATSYHAFFAAVTALATDPLSTPCVCTPVHICWTSRAVLALLQPKPQIVARARSESTCRRR